MRPFAIVTMAVLALLGASACEEEQRFPTAGDLDEVDLQVDHTLTVGDSGFDPNELSVREGDVIEVTNEGTRTHTFTADERDGGVTFDVTLEPGDVLTLVAPEPAEITYRDRTEPDNDGVLVVRPMEG